MQILKFLINSKNKFNHIEMITCSKYFLILCFLLLCNLYSQNAWTQESKAEKEFHFAQKLHEDGLYLLAAEQFKDFAKNYPNNEQADNALYLCGESYLSEKNYNLAFDAFRELEISYPLSVLIPKSRYQMAFCQKKLHNFEAAAKLFQRVPVFHPESEFAVKALLESGRAYIKAGKKELALTIYLALINDYPDSRKRLDAYHEIVQIQISLGKFEEATKTIDGIFRALGPDLNDPQIDFLRAEVFEKLGQVDKAESAYLKLLESFPNSPAVNNAHYQLGLLYQHNGDYDISLKHFDHYISNSDTTEQTNPVHIKKGDILFIQKQYDAAFNSYHNALSYTTASDKIEAEFKIAIVLLILEKNQLAVKQFTEIISDEAYLESKDSIVNNFVENAYLELTDLLIKIHQYKDALDLMKKYSERFANSSQLANMLFKKAEIFEKYLKDITRTIRLYDEFLETYPFSPQVDEVQLGIARCYEILTEYQMALTEYQKYLARYPAGDDYDWVMNRMRLISETLNTSAGSGMNQIASLFGKYTESESNNNWNFELGKVFFEQKDFNNAISCFKKELVNATNNASKESAYFYLGKSYFRLAEKSRFLNQNNKVAAYFDSAAISLKYLQVHQDSSNLTEETFLVLTQIDLDTITGHAARQSRLFELKSEWENRFPESNNIDFILIKLANEIIATASFQQDSTLIQQALEVYQQIIDNYPDSKYYEEAQYREFEILYHLEADSLALTGINDFINTKYGSRYLPQALLLKAKLEKKTENFTSAIEILNKLKSDYFYSALVRQAQKELADIYFEMGDFQSALENYKTDYNFLDSIFGIESEKVDLLIMFKKAQANENLGQFNKALEEYIDLIQESPTHEYSQYAMFAVARISHKQNKLTLAKEYYQSILEHASTSEYKYQANNALGDIYFQQGLYQEANRHYLSAIQMAGNAAEEKHPLSQSIRCMYKLKKFAVAESDVKKFKKKYKDSKNEEGQFLVDKGNACIAEKQFELAEKAFKKLKSDFKNTDFAAKGEFGLGAIKLITNHTEEALEILTNIPSKYPDSEVTVLTYFNLGDFYCKSQQIENAISAFKQILEHPQAKDYYKKALQYLIKCYSDLKLWEQAIVYTHKYLDKYPKAEDSFYYKVELAKILMYLKEYNRSIDHFNQLKPFASDEIQAEIQFYIGQCFNEMGKFEHAAAEYLKVKYLTKPTKLPWHVTAQFEASKCLIRYGETTIARKILQRIVKEQGAESNFGRFAKQRLEELEKGKNPLVQKIVK